MFDFIRKRGSVYEKAAEDARAIVRANPDHRDGWRTIAVSCIRLRMPEEAMEAAQRLLRIAGDWPHTFVTLGDVRFAQGNVAKAEEDYHSALERDQGCGAAHHGLARVASARGEFETAVSHLGRAVSADAVNPEHWMKLARTRAAQYRFVDSSQALLRYLQLRPRGLDEDEVRRLQRIAVWFSSVGERATQTGSSGGEVRFNLVGQRYLAVDAKVDGLVGGFVIDTGSEIGLTVPPSIVNARYRSRVLDYGVREVPFSSEPIPVRYIVVDRFECGGGVIENLPAFDFRLPVPEEVATFNPLALRGAVRFDFSKDVVSFEPSDAPHADGDLVVPFHVYGSHANHAYVQAFIGGRGPFNMLLDTSVAEVSITQRAAKTLRLAVNRRHAGVSIRLAGHELHYAVATDFEHEAYDDGFVPDGALGTRFLRQFREVLIDYPKRALVLRS